MKYLILSQGEEYAKELSTEMWLLTRPDGDGSTKYYVDWSVHADGRAAVSVPGEAVAYEDEEGETAYRYTEDQPIHKDCDAAAFRAVINESVTPEEADAIEAGIRRFECSGRPSQSLIPWRPCGDRFGWISRRRTSAFLHWANR